MPAASPKLAVHDAPALHSLGRALRQRRLELGVSSVVASQAAGVSRVTLHRIERGEASVTIGAYAAAAGALGWTLACSPLAGHSPSQQNPSCPATPESALPASIALKQYPQLRRLAWQRNEDDTLSPQEALALYERNWRHLDQSALQPQERALLAQLAATAGGGRLLV